MTDRCDRSQASHCENETQKKIERIKTEIKRGETKLKIKIVTSYNESRHQEIGLVSIWITKNIYKSTK